MTAIPPHSLQEQVTTLLATRFGVDRTEAAPEVTFNALDLDSLALVELSLALQDLFGVRVQDDELGAENTIGEAAELVAAKLGEAEAEAETEAEAGAETEAGARAGANGQEEAG